MNRLNRYLVLILNTGWIVYQYQTGWRSSTFTSSSSSPTDNCCSRECAPNKCVCQEVPLSIPLISGSFTWHRGWGLSGSAVKRCLPVRGNYTSVQWDIQLLNKNKSIALFFPFEFVGRGASTHTQFNVLALERRTPPIAIKQTVTYCCFLARFEIFVSCSLHVAIVNQSVLFNS